MKENNWKLSLKHIQQTQSDFVKPMQHISYFPAAPYKHLKIPKWDFAQSIPFKLVSQQCINTTKIYILQYNVAYFLRSNQGENKCARTIKNKKTELSQR